MTIYQKVLAAYGLINESISEKMSSISVANPFSPSRSYEIDDAVVYNNVLYVCTNAHSGPWSEDDFSNATVDYIVRLISSKLVYQAQDSINRNIAQKVSLSDLAPEFDEGSSYKRGELVCHEGSLFRCVNDRESGEWSSSDFSRTLISDEIIDRCLLSSVAPEFDENISYSAGQLVKHDGNLYCCNEDRGAGEWDPSDFSAATVSGALGLKATAQKLKAMTMDNYTPAIFDVYLEKDVTYRIMVDSTVVSGYTIRLHVPEATGWRSSGTYGTVETESIHASIILDARNKTSGDQIDIVLDNPMGIIYLSETDIPTLSLINGQMKILKFRFAGLNEIDDTSEPIWVLTVEDLTAENVS